MTRNIVDIAAEGHPSQINLAAFVGHRITQVRGYITRPFGDALFVLTGIDFENGESLFVEGEHDCAYLVGEAGHHNEAVLQAFADLEE